MLQRTFLHIPGIGPARERRLWAAGLGTWRDYLVHDARLGRSDAERARIRGHVSNSLAAFESGRWEFFEACLPREHAWRAFGDFGDRALYLDIETTGLGEHDGITLIGLYDGRDVRTFVAGRNLADAFDDIDRYPLLVTFNGACFDLPVIRRQFPGALKPHLHIDLRYPLRRLGYRGGLKAIEQALGIRRSEATCGLDGWDAVRLWHEYRLGSPDALALLTAYNAEDVRHLKGLMEFAFQSLAARLAAPDGAAAQPRTLDGPAFRASSSLAPASASRS